MGRLPTACLAESAPDCEKTFRQGKYIMLPYYTCPACQRYKYWERIIINDWEACDDFVVDKDYQHFTIPHVTLTAAWRREFFGARPLLITFSDGRKPPTRITTEIWKQGLIPPYFREILVPNATIT